MSIGTAEDVEGGVSVTLAVHHASICRGLQFKPCISALLPLLPKQAHSFAIAKHAMNKIKEATLYHNVDQIPVVTADQPLFAIAKQIQWQWPQSYGEVKFIIMFGGLLIQMAAFQAIGGLKLGLYTKKQHVLFLAYEQYQRDNCQSLYRKTISLLLSSLW